MSQVINTSAESFDRDVLERSREIPIVVDFWAPWCGPCRALGPVLEKLAKDDAGKWQLVKANTDELPEAATRFNVSGIPAVFAVIDGNVVDFFTGAMPEPLVRQWLDRVLAAGALQVLKCLEQDSPAVAEARYRELISQDPRNADAKLGLARVLFAQRKNAEVETVLKELEDTGFLDAEGQKLRAALAVQSKQGLDVDDIQARASANPNDLELQLQFAEALAGREQYERSLEILLSLVQRDKKGVGQRAREFMIQIFQTLPADSELGTTYRRKLSMALY